MNSAKERVVDIGGGFGEYLYWRSRQELDKQFIILEPDSDKIAQIKGKPRNLHIVQWREEKKSALPFKPHSLDEANLNMLYAQLRSSEGVKSDDNVLSVPIYKKILGELTFVLKPEGKLVIVDSETYVRDILSMLKALGYKLEKALEYLKDSDRTFWSRRYAEYGNDFPQWSPFLIEASSQQPWIVEFSTQLGQWVQEAH